YLCFFYMLRSPPRFILFPYTTLFRSNAWVFAVACIVIFSIVLYFFSAPRRYRFAGTLILVFGIFWMSRTFYQLFFVNLLLWGLRSEEHTSELQSRENLVCRLLLEKKK